MKREAETTRALEAGCYVCHGTEAHWRGAQVGGTAARHHDRTGHATWWRVVAETRYGHRAPAAEQLDLEHAIAEAAYG